MTGDGILGKTINGYEVTGVIGRGGMATVYKARQLSMNRTVALKVLPRQFVDDETYIQRFNREVKIVSQLEHRNIVPVYDYGEYERQPFIAMRYMPDGSLDQLLRDGPIPVDKVLDIIRQIAPALDYAHNKHVLHRDLKPSNVLLDDGGGAYLTDFGIARILGEASGSTITTQGVVGTPSYMSPEQAQGHSLDGRSDVYSLGIMLFEMLTGRRPFESDTAYGVAVMQVTTPPPSPRAMNPTLSPVVEQVIYKALSKQPATRYQTAEAMVKAFQQALDNPLSASETEKRASYSQRTQPHTPPPLIYPPPQTFTGSPYSAPASQPASRPNQSAWMPPVQAKRQRKRREVNLWASLLIGSLIGCFLLTALLGVVAYLVGNVNDLLGTDTVATETITATPIESFIATLDPTSEAARLDLLGVSTAVIVTTPTDDLAPTLPPDVVPSAVLPPTQAPMQVTVYTATPDATATIAPIGVR